MLSFFTSKKTVARNRELGPGGVHLKDYGIPGRINLVEALSDMGKDEDRVFDHLDQNDAWVDLDAQKDTIKSALQPKSDVQVTVEATEEMVNELQACIIDDYWTEESIQRRAIGALHDSVENWLEGIGQADDAHDSSSDDEHSVSSKETSGVKANVYQLPKFETFQKTKFNAPIFDDETYLTAYNDAILSSAVCWGKSGEESEYDSADDMPTFSKSSN
ncbi:uncharacterized protein FRV6_14403 [Fusarium oxysporum]|uniref:Uncharacterized protein n=1 Tax=Fusarium oxysporum TaxID=5507 RepID=A0A2H3TRH1_FUSOX|nr:uncharacterized protein FRV6_14403 [Fusarium oxysporum]